MYIHHHEIKERYVGRKQRGSDHLPPMLAQEMEFIMSLRGMNRHGWVSKSSTSTCHVHSDQVIES